MPDPEPGPLRAVTFDAFGTIIDPGRDVLLRVSAAACENLRPGLEPETLLGTWDRYFFSADVEPFRNLEDTTEASLARAFQDHGIDADPGPYVEMLDRLWRQATAYPETRDVLAALDGIRRGVVSNADDAFLKDILSRNGLRFGVVMTSEAARAYKPRPRIFELALEALDVDPPAAAHVGDSLTADVGGAKRIGMRTIWVNRTRMRRGPGDPRPDFEVASLREVPEILRGLHEKD